MTHEHNGKSERQAQILEGVRVIDMTSVLFGSFSTQILGDLGADIIKIEGPGRKGGDILRYAGKPPVTKGMGPLFQHYNRNKRSVLLDASVPEDKAALLRLIETADMFISNVRMNGLARLGLDYESLKAVKSDLVYVHCTGYGADGPYASLQAYDDLIQAASGATDLLPRLDGSEAPRYLPSMIADKSSGLFGAVAALAALMHHQKTGEGQFVEVPMLECFTYFNMTEHLYGHTFVPPTGPAAYSRVLNPNRRLFKTKDGYLAILPHADDTWDIFFEMAGMPPNSFTGDPRFQTGAQRKEHISEIYEMIENAALAHTADEWVRMLSERNVPCMKARHLDEVMEDPHLQATGFFMHRQHPTEGEYVSLRHPIRFDKTPATIRYDPPLPGEHTAEVLAEIGPQSRDSAKRASSGRGDN
ncbi:CoA transferase [Sphingobium sp.]|uniref:CaiB/BaiF CoA transferase family protein n=1 Tax=Sphingobium sp. TaxID=1912891 RepID=UPI0028BD5058|nr:CoA transferase [Sphingobium sp.]